MGGPLHIDIWMFLPKADLLSSQGCSKAISSVRISPELWAVPTAHCLAPIMELLAKVAQSPP